MRGMMTWLRDNVRGVSGVLVLLASGCSLAAATGTVQTKAGTLFSGTVRLATNRLVIANPRLATLVVVREANLGRVLFDLPAPGSDREGESSEATSVPWQSSGVGEATLQSGVWRLRGPGLGQESGGEQYQFVHKTVRGKSELVARVTQVRSSGGEAVAGVMMRESLEPGAKHIFLGAQSPRGGKLEWRKQAGGALEQRPEATFSAPCWLKLKREGTNVAAYRSRTGRVWQLLERMELPMAEEIYVGLALASSPAARPDPASVPATWQSSTGSAKARRWRLAPGRPGSGCGADRRLSGRSARTGRRCCFRGLWFGLAFGSRTWRRWSLGGCLSVFGAESRPGCPGCSWARASIWKGS